MPAQDNSVQPATVAPRDSWPRTIGSSMPEVTPPCPSAKDHAILPGPEASRSCTNSGSNAQGAAAGTE